MNMIYYTKIIIMNDTCFGVYASFLEKSFPQRDNTLLVNRLISIMVEWDRAIMISFSPIALITYNMLMVSIFYYNSQS